MRKNVYIISTGTELSSGRSKDTNAPYIARELTQKGFEIAGLMTIPDDPKLLISRIKHLLDQVEIDLLVMTGGLGPTEDDFTVDVFLKLFTQEPREELTALRRFQELCRHYHDRVEANFARRQVRIPSLATPLANRIGLAPGFILEWKRKKNQGNCMVAVMPGVPREMTAMFQSELIPILEKNLLIQKKKIRYSYYLYDIAESTLQKKIFGLSQNRVKDHVELAESTDVGPFYKRDQQRPNDFRWGVSADLAFIKIFWESEDHAFLKQLNQSLRQQLNKHVLDCSVEEALASICTFQKIRIGTAESCTGGLAAKLISDVPGSSAYFQGSIVSYSNDIKEKHLGVAKEILAEKGAVSSECAISMAKGLCCQLDLDFALSISGIAGPEGGTKMKPVGLVYLGFADRKGHSEFHKLNFKLDREGVRIYSARLGLFYFYQFIRKHSKSSSQSDN